MRLLKLLVVGVLLVLLALLLSPAVLFYMGLQEEPLVRPVASVSQQDVGRLKQLLRENDPRDLRDGENHTFTITERDLNLGLRSVLPFAHRQQSLVFLTPGDGRLQYTLSLPDNPLGRYFNLILQVGEQAGSVSPLSLSLGDWQLPGWSLVPLVKLAGKYLGLLFEEFSGAHQALQDVSIDEGQLSITYRWDQALAQQIEQRGREIMLPSVDRERVLAYYQVLTEVSRNSPASASLAQLLKPLFEMAVIRGADGDAAQENRALLLMLGTVLNRSAMSRLVGGDPADLAPGHRYVRWTLRGRNDLAQHFAVSAAIATAGGGVLADAIGVFKELDDSRGGSGFSFADLLADRAGVELAMAAGGPGAREIQRLMAVNPLDEAVFMPPIDRLPEGIQEMEFKLRYSDLDDARYAIIKDEIDRRIGALPSYR